MNHHADVSALLDGLSHKKYNFNDVISFIDARYNYKPVSFTNGELVNYEGDNEGSAKVFGLAKHHTLNQLDTLKLFGEHLDTVVSTPNGVDHPNIRNFLHWGWQAFLMQHNPLTPLADFKRDQAGIFNKETAPVAEKSVDTVADV